MGGGDDKIDFDEDKRMKFETSKEVNINVCNAEGGTANAPQDDAPLHVQGEKAAPT